MCRRSSPHQWAGGTRQLSSTTVRKAEVTSLLCNDANREMYSWELITFLICYIYFYLFLKSFLLTLFTLIYYYICDDRLCIGYLLRQNNFWRHSWTMILTGSSFFISSVLYLLNLIFTNSYLQDHVQFSRYFVYICDFIE